MRNPGILRLLRLYAVSATVCSVGLLHGCGGSGGTQTVPGGNHAAPVTQQGAGRAVFSVRWPERGGASRLIPAAAESIKITIRRGETMVAERVLPRPSEGGVSETVFDNLPLGDATATATAYPNADGTGVAQSAATVPVAVAAGDNTPLRLTMFSTIARIDVAPAEVTLEEGESAQLTATARNAAGEVVLVLPQTITWESSDSTVLTVGTGGLAGGVRPGTGSILATETESGRRGTASVTVQVAAPFRPARLVPAEGNSWMSAAHPYAINERGQVVGYRTLHPLPFLWNPDVPNGATGRLIAFTHPSGGSIRGTARDVTDAGDVLISVFSAPSYVWKPDAPNGDSGRLDAIGTYWSVSGFNRAGALIATAVEVGGRPGPSYFLQDSEFSILAANGSLLNPTDLNEAGQVAAHSSIGDPYYTAFLWQRQAAGVAATRIGDGFTRGMNEQGWVVGQSHGGGTWGRPVLWKEGQAILAPPIPGSNEGFAMAINNRGQIVGWYQTISGRVAFLWHPVEAGGDGTFRNLDELDSPHSPWRYHEANDINDAGQIVCVGKEADGFLTAVLLNPKR